DGLSWSADGLWLATVHSAPGQGSSLVVLPSDGGDLRTLLRVGEPAYAAAVAFSRDGSQIAYSFCVSYFDCDLHAVTVDGHANLAGPPRDLVTHAEALLSVAWSGDDRSLIYEEGGALWRAPLASGAAPSELNLGKSPGIFQRSPTISSGRDRLAFEQGR